MITKQHPHAIPCSDRKGDESNAVKACWSPAEGAPRDPPGDRRPLRGCRPGPAYDGGSGPCPGIVQTVGEFPPLGGAVAGTAGVTITENVPPSGGPFPPPCVPSDTTLCIDDSPGDRRFEVKASYSTSLAGGLSGN